MAKVKEINSRIINKHDIEVNWNKASTFIPQLGEIIVYDIDENYNFERFKIGDGITNVINLPFTNIELDTTLLVEGKAADAKAVGDAIESFKDTYTAITTAEIDEICGAESFSYDESGNVSILSIFNNSTVTHDGNGNVIISELGGNL